MPHVVVVPYPGAGNINPALQIAKLLHRHGAYVTFVNTEHNHGRVQDTEGAAAVRERGGFHFEAIPDGLPEADRGKQDCGRGLSLSTSTRCAAPLRDLIPRLNNGGEPGVPSVTCVLATALMSFALAVARELGIPAMAFWGGSAASLMAHMRIRELEERGYVPLKDESLLTNGYLETTVIDWIPGMPPISLGDISSFIRTTDPDDFGLRFNESEANNCAKAGALILNTFDALEADVLVTLAAEYRHIYAIGPLGTLLRSGTVDPIGLSLWKQDAGCLPWLDTQRQSSVVYFSFGSHTVLTPEQVAEFAWGLASSGHQFLWSIRDSLAAGPGGRDGGAVPRDHMVPAGGGAAPPGRGLLPDAQRVDLDVRERGRRRAHGVLAGVRGPVHQLLVRLRGVGRRRPVRRGGEEEAGCRACQARHGERGDAEKRGEVEGGGGRPSRRVVV